MDKNREWKSRVQDIFQVCQDEIKRTTEIGKKMFSASKTNSCLHESYEELGVLVQKALKSGELKWDNPKVDVLLKQIETCEKDLNKIEEEVNNIRFASGPETVDKKEEDS